MCIRDRGMEPVHKLLDVCCSANNKDGTVPAGKRAPSTTLSHTAMSFFDHAFTHSSTNATAVSCVSVVGSTARLTGLPFLTEQPVNKTRQAEVNACGLNWHLDKIPPNVAFNGTLT